MLQQTKSTSECPANKTTPTQTCIQVRPVLTWRHMKPGQIRAQHREQGTLLINWSLKTCSMNVLSHPHLPHPFKYTSHPRLMQTPPVDQDLIHKTAFINSDSNPELWVRWSLSLSDTLTYSWRWIGEQVTAALCEGQCHTQGKPSREERVLCVTDLQSADLPSCPKDTTLQHKHTLLYYVFVRTSCSVWSIRR